MVITNKGNYSFPFSFGSSVKCVDTFRIAFTEESKVFVEQKEGYDCLSRLLYLSSDTENLFF